MRFLTAITVFSASGRVGGSGHLTRDSNVLPPRPVYNRQVSRGGKTLGLDLHQVKHMNEEVLEYSPVVNPVGCPGTDIVLVGQNPTSFPTGGSESSGISSDGSWKFEHVQKSFRQAVFLQHVLEAEGFTGYAAPNVGDLPYGCEEQVIVSSTRTRPLIGTREGDVLAETTPEGAARVAVKGLQMLRALHRAGMVHGGDFGSAIVINEIGEYGLRGLDAATPFVTAEGVHIPEASRAERSGENPWRLSPRELLGFRSTRADDMFRLAETVFDIAMGRSLQSSHQVSDLEHIRALKTSRKADDVEPVEFNEFYAEVLALGPTAVPDYNKWIKKFADIAGIPIVDVNNEIDSGIVRKLHSAVLPFEIKDEHHGCPGTMDIGLGGGVIIAKFPDGDSSIAGISEDGLWRFEWLSKPGPLMQTLEALLVTQGFAAYSLEPDRTAMETQCPDQVVFSSSLFRPLILSRSHGAVETAIEVDDFSIAQVALAALRGLRMLHNAGMVHGGDFGSTLHSDNSGNFAWSGLDEAKPFVSREGILFVDRNCSPTLEIQRLSPRELMGFCTTRADDIFRLAELILELSTSSTVPHDLKSESQIADWKNMRTHEYVNPIFMEFYNYAKAASSMALPDYDPWIQAFSLIRPDEESYSENEPVEASSPGALRRT